MASTKKTKLAVPAGLDAAGKAQALKTAMTQIERDFGAGSTYISQDVTKPIPVIFSPSPT